MNLIINKFLNKILRKKKKIFFFDIKTDLSTLESIILNCKVIGIDTEFDWRNTYFPKLSLLQISTKREIFLVDCLDRKDFDIINQILESNEVLKLFHSSRSDATVLFSNLDIKTKNIFDIQIAEKLITNSDITSYAKIVQKYCFINLPKSETNSNWLKRPFSKSQIDYAAEDVDYLIDIYKKQKKILLGKNLLNQAVDLSKKEIHKGNRMLKESRMEKIKNASQRYKKIFLWREDIAIEKNVPSGFLFKDKSIKKLVKLSNADKHLQKKVFDVFGDTVLTKRFIKDFF